MFKNTSFKIGIINTKTGKLVKEVMVGNNGNIFATKEMLLDKVLKTSERVVSWFDDKDTFFSEFNLWEYFKVNMNIQERIKQLIEDKSLTDAVYESIVVFPEDANRGIEHEFFVERIKN